MNRKLLSSYKNFVKYVILESLSSFGVRDIAVSHFDINEHTGKYYPHFIVTICEDVYVHYSYRVKVAEKISDETEIFFPSMFNIGTAWVTMTKLKC